LDDTTEKLVGSWRLVACEHKRSDGSSHYPWAKDAQGTLIYTADGRMSAFVMKANRKPFHAKGFFDGSPEEKARAVDDCLSYSGRYRVESNQVIHILELSLFPNWIGTEQARFFKLEGSSLSLSSLPYPTPTGSETAYITWKRND